MSYLRWTLKEAQVFIKDFNKAKEKGYSEEELCKMHGDDVFVTIKKLKDKIKKHIPNKLI